MRQLAGARMGEMDAVGGAELGGLAIEIGAGRGVVVAIVGEARADIDIGTAGLGHGVPVDVVEGSEIPGQGVAAHRRRADPHQRDLTVGEHLDQRVDPRAVEFAPTVRERIDALVAVAHRLQVVGAEHDDGIGDLRIALEVVLGGLRPVDDVLTDETAVAPGTIDDPHIRAVFENLVQPAAEMIGEGVAEHRDLHLRLGLADRSGRRGDHGRRPGLRPTDRSGDLRVHRRSRPRGTIGRGGLARLGLARPILPGPVELALLRFRRRAPCRSRIAVVVAIIRVAAAAARLVVAVAPLRLRRGRRQDEEQERRGGTERERAPVRRGPRRTGFPRRVCSHAPSGAVVPELRQPT